MLKSQSLYQYLVVDQVNLNLVHHHQVKPKMLPHQLSFQSVEAVDQKVSAAIVKVAQVYQIQLFHK